MTQNVIPTGPPTSRIYVTFYTISLTLLGLIMITSTMITVRTVLKVC